MPGRAEPCITAGQHRCHSAASHLIAVVTARMAQEWRTLRERARRNSTSLAHLSTPRRAHEPSFRSPLAQGLRVGKALQGEKGKGLVLVEPKRRAGLRTLVLPGTLLARLRAHRRGQTAQRLAAGPAWQDLDFLVAQTEGRPGTVGAPEDWRAWKPLLVQAEVRPARLHDARHTAGTLLLLQQGVFPRVAMQLLGHS